MILAYIIMVTFTLKYTLAEEVSFSQIPIGNHTNMVWLNSIESISNLGQPSVCKDSPNSKACGFCARGVLQIKNGDGPMCLRTLSARPGYRLDSLCLSNSVNKEKDGSLSCKEYYITNTMFACSHHFVRDNKRVSRVNKRFCSIDYQGKCRGRSVTLQNQQVYWILDSSGLYYLDEISIINGQNASDILFYDCDGDCSNSKNGDATFCSHFQCSVSSACYCNFKPDRFNLLLQSGREHVNIYCYGQTRASVQVDIDYQSIEIGSNLYCSNCIASCEENMVRINMFSSDYSHVRVCKSGICRFSDNVGSIIDIEMPYETFLTKTNVMVDIWSKHVKEHKVLVLSCPIAEVCHVLRCTFCIPKLVNWHCFSTYDTLIWSIIALIMLILIVALIILCKTVLTALTWLFWPVLSLIKVIKWTFKILTSSVSSDMEMTKYHYKKLDGEPDDDRTSIVKEDENDGKKPKVSKHGYKVFPDPSRRPRTPRFGMIIMFFSITFLMIALSQACSEFSYISARSNQCTKDSKSTICRFKTVVDLDLSPVSQDSCIGLKSHDGTNMGFLKIKTKSLDFVCDQTLLYYTFNPTASCQSIHSCWESGICFGSTCETLSSKQKFNDILSPDQNLGESGCIRSCGGWACGCFHFSEGCIFYRRDIKNDERKVIKVSRCNSWTLRSILEVSLVSQNGSYYSEPERIILTSNNVIRFKDILIHIKSSSPPIVDTNWCLLSNEGVYSMSRCSAKDQFSHGIIGEVQCMSRFDAMYSKSSCNTDFNLIQIIQDEKTIRCRSSYADVNKILKEFSLPLYENNYHFIMDGTDLILEEQSISRLVLQMSFDQLDISSISTVSKVYINSASVSGCVNCMTGAMLTLQARADENGTLVHIDCDGFSTVLIINNINSASEVIIKPKQFKKEYNCKVVTSGESFNLSVKASLIDLMSSLSHESIRVSTNVTSMPGDFAVSTWLSGLSLPGGSLLHLIYLLMSYFLIVTALILFMLLVLKFLLKMCVRGLMGLNSLNDKKKNRLD